MIPSFVLIAVSGAIVAAQSTTVVDLMLPAVDPQSLVGSVVAASPSITTYAVECADNVDPAECGLLHATTIAQGPSTWSVHYSHSDAEYGSYEQDMECDIDRDEDTIRCSVRMVEWSGDVTRTSSTAVATNGLDNLFFPVMITAGLNKLGAAPGATGGIHPAVQTEDVSFTTVVTRPLPSGVSTTVPEPTETSDEPSESADETDTAEATEATESTATNSQITQTTSTPTPSSTDDDAAEVTTTNTDNAAFPRATQNAILAGAAALVGGVLML